MKPKPKSATWFAPLIAAMALAGCASQPGAEHREHHPGASTASTLATTPSGVPSGKMDMMDMKSMCEMHKKMMSGKTPEEQKAMMDERMKSMSPEMRLQHMTMMEKCK